MTCNGECFEEAFGRPRPEGATAHTLACLLETPDLYVVGRDAEEAAE